MAAEAEVSAAAVVAAEDAVVVVVATTATTLTISNKPRGRLHPPLPSSPAPSTRTCPQETGRAAVCTSNGAVKVFSVASLPPALGKMCTPPSLKINETVTSSADLH